MLVIVRAVVIGIVALFVATIPRNLVFVANLEYYPNVPWAVPVIALYLWIFWRYLSGAGPPEETAESRRRNLNANRLPGRVWAWALFAGGLGIVALVLGLRVVNRLIVLPEQHLPDVSPVSRVTMVSLLLMSALFAGVVEEASFRGDMQGPIARQHGPVVSILITGTMFAVAHLDFTLMLWPYYVAVAAVYGGVTHLTNSILPAVVLHTSGNVYSNFDLWLHGQAEWQAKPGALSLIWETGMDRPFWFSVAAFALAGAATVGVCRVLARVARTAPAIEALRS